MLIYIKALSAKHKSRSSKRSFSIPWTMSAYFFDLHQCDGAVTRQRDGENAASAVNPRDEAIELARQFMAKEVAAGRLCLSCWIVVTDKQRRHVLTLQFGEALTFVSSHHSCSSAERAPPE